MPYVAPLRSAVLHCAGKGMPFSARAVAAIGQVTKQSRASAYCRSLVREHRLRLAGCMAGEPLFERGQHYRSWAARQPRTKPGGNRVRTYRAQPARALAATE